jgi:tetratricopeptide (TPR) repeat protein
MHREFELVSIALRRNEVSEARARTNALLRLHPRHPNADLLNGVVARAEGNLTGSFEILSELHRRLPLEPAPLIQLASTLNAMGKLDEAIAAYQQVLQQRPTHPDAAFGLGLALKKSQPWRAGRTSFALHDVSPKELRPCTRPCDARWTPFCEVSPCPRSTCLCQRAGATRSSFQ